MEQSLSCFTLYLKLNKDPKYLSSVHFIPLKKDIKKHLYDKLLRNNFNNPYIDCFFNSYNNNHKAVISLIVPFNSSDFWMKNKNILKEKLLNEFITKTGLSINDLEIKETATPISFYNWSYSYKGACFGWAPLISQVFPNFQLSSKIPNLYFVGHWLGMGHGISTVAYLGKNVANTIINRRN
jgi:phytoene dehydrogenase-like protein